MAYGRLNTFLTEFSASQNGKPRSRSEILNTRALFKVSFKMHGHDFSLMSIGGKNTNGGTGLSKYVQRIEVPNFKTGESLTDNNIIGTIMTPNGIVIPENNNLTMAILNTEYPLTERCFLPWMYEVTRPEWAFDDHPYTYATIEIEFQELCIKYIFTHCRPINVETLNPSHSENNILTRDVIFEFNYMYAFQYGNTTVDNATPIMNALAAPANMVRGAVDSVKNAWGDIFSGDSSDAYKLNDTW